jgi:hypothetical protein
LIYPRKDGYQVLLVFLLVFSHGGPTQHVVQDNMSVEMENLRGDLRCT